MKSININPTIAKAGLCFAIMLLICLFPMPYGYYNFVRFIAMIVFGVLAYYFYKQSKTSLTVSAIILVLLFQPFFKIPLGRLIWNLIDVVCAILLFVLWKINKVSLKSIKIEEPKNNNDIEDWDWCSSMDYGDYDEEEISKNSQETLDKIKSIGKELEDKIDLELARRGWNKNRFGGCHDYWEVKKYILKVHYGITWFTPQEENPRNCYD